MSAEQLATRIIAEQSGVASYKIRRGDITEADFHRVADAVTEMQQMPLYIDQTGGISIAQLTARARRLKRQRGLDLLVVDYLQLLVRLENRAAENRVQELTEITTGLKALAKELNIPILACSQLSRQVEQRDDKRPQLSDLRESGSIEQDADVVLFVYPRGILPEEPRAAPGHGGAYRLDRADGERARPRRDHHRQAAPRSDRHGGVAIRRGGYAVQFACAGRHDRGNPLEGLQTSPQARAATLAWPILGLAAQTGEFA